MRRKKEKANKRNEKSAERGMRRNKSEEKWSRGGEEQKRDNWTRKWRNERRNARANAEIIADAREENAGKCRDRCKNATRRRSFSKLRNTRFVGCEMKSIEMNFKAAASRSLVFSSIYSAGSSLRVFSVHQVCWPWIYVFFGKASSSSREVLFCQEEFKINDFEWTCYLMILF